MAAEELSAIYKPSPWGEKYHALTQHEALGGGAAGGGKTEVLLADPFVQIAVEHERMTNKKHPHPIGRGESRGAALILRRTFPMIEDTMLRGLQMIKKVDPGVKWDGQKHIATLTSGYRYQFGHCKDPGDWEIYQGTAYTYIGFDELTQFLKNQYNQVRSRLRSTDPVLRPMMKCRAMSNPFMDRRGMEGVKVDDDPLWVRKRFVDPAPLGWKTLFRDVKLKSGEVRRMTRIFAPAKLEDNPNKAYSEDYEAWLLTQPIHIRKALLEGDWYVQVGSFFGDDWQRDVHVVPAFKIPKDWLRFRSMDWGFKAPGCVLWWAMDPEGNLYCEYEFYFKGMTATKVAERIKQREQQYDLFKGRKSLITGPADTQLWEARGASAKSMAEEMADVGVTWVKADKTSRARNAGLLLSRLRDHGGYTKRPGVVFFENCKMCIQTIPAILASPGDPEMPQDGGEDHALDAALYGCAFASRGRAGIPSMKREDDDNEDAPVRRGNLGYGDLF